MEAEQNKPNKKIITIFLTIIVFFIIATVILSITISNQNVELKNQDIKYDSIYQKMSVTNGALNKETQRSDSMNRILVKIHNYMPMASLLQYRDSVCSKLPYKSGDIVLMKPDSSKWVIISTIIKGGKWQHEIKYLLRDSSGKQVEVEPETIY